MAPLDAHLQQRLLGPLPEPRGGGQLILCWLRSALRGHENPALDVALAAAEDSGLPLLVYQGLSERYPHASDRHHRFLLEGARDLQAELAGRGIRHVLHLERPGHDGPVLRELAEQAALVVTDEVPISPLRDWVERLDAAVPTPVVRVDASCVAPMGALQKRPTRAFAFRKGVREFYGSSLLQPWAEREVAAIPHDLELPFEPVDLDTDLSELIAACRIDHTVAPVPGEHGGSRAGYERWEAFRSGGLRGYAKRRNDPLSGGVSRMSAYLHHGMVSPFRLAREAAEDGSKGAEKYLDELLVWRELAWHFCHHTPDADSMAALPDWARETLAEHSGDPRDVLAPEDVERGRTGDLLWDACQASLLVRGELHNNLRMTWGKALLDWCATPEEALALSIDLNHRFALDGRDPSSYGGLLWCFGQFDRPFPPARPVSGTLRERSTDVHAQRIDVGAFRERFGALGKGERLRVAVLGAGIAGLTCARALQDRGHEVLVLDKARGPGGRTSLRRSSDERFAFDHGAQYFTARDPRFRRRVEQWQRAGIVAPWEGHIVAQEEGELRPTSDKERFVAVPGMNALAKHLARDLDVRVRSRIVSLRQAADGWWTTDEGGEVQGPFDRIVLSLPAEQAAALLPEESPLHATVAGVPMLPSIAWMVGFEEPWAVPFDGAFVNEGPLSWIARNSSKPGRPPGDAWVIHSAAAWADREFDSGPESQARAMRAALEELTDVPLPGVAVEDLHRWKYALTDHALEAGALVDGARGLVVCGDWCAGSRVEGAFLSGAAAAGRILV